MERYKFVHDRLSQEFDKKLTSVGSQQLVVPIWYLLRVVFSSGHLRLDLVGPVIYSACMYHLPTSNNDTVQTCTLLKIIKGSRVFECAFLPYQRLASQMCCILYSLYKLSLHIPA